ncbi:PREDICTED: phospholipase A2 inhibitor and Ly6/PLAUR domain-containing protein-like [Nanorana parkeri]|uniref:phospholipase A2 inhibitor and Ly6/PLAUR domain-containing protein-like n=1 Tax=Nanorana parkeri TaxID=125878 RepID=UPI0008542CD3|nr:PREDICTED: phospholipase A2 inhibitor and Ly6/PLAUR domain-containing protein-like [Nanorana parkeri]
MSTTSLSCYGELESCAPHHACSSTFKVSYFADGQISYQTIRSCIPEFQCGLYGTLTLLDANIVMGIGCCKKDGCIPSVMARRPVNAKPNGVRCKTCTSATAEFCDTDETMECSGNEDRCINYGLIISSTQCEPLQLTAPCHSALALFNRPGYRRPVQDA